VSGFRIFERNLRGASDEIDIVVQVDGRMPFCWSVPGAPYVLVEAKNWAETVGSGVVALLLRKLETRRGFARIGLLMTTSGFSSDARAEELKEARGILCVAMFERDDIQAWIGAGDPDGFLNDHIGRAMLR
jgi:hypothetical protein